MGGGVRRVEATFDSRWRATLRDVASLTFGSGVAPALDLPGHVRGASAVRRVGDALWIIQDDVNAVVQVPLDSAGDGRPRADRVQAILLPRGEGRARTFGDERGNKAAKMDLEACVVLPDGRLLAFGSGSSSARESIVVLDPKVAQVAPEIGGGGAAAERSGFSPSGGALDESIAGVRVFEAHALFAQLRADLAFAGSELNLEGAILVPGGDTGDVLRLFQRGNGAPAVFPDGPLLPVNATADLLLSEVIAYIDRAGPVPEHHNVIQYVLGGVDGVCFTFTDAALLRGGQVAFIACAEDSPDAIRDGEIVGCVFGLIDPSQTSARITHIADDHGAVSLLKLEGLEPVIAPPAQPSSGHLSFHVVADMDSPDQPAILARLDVTGLAG